MIRNIRIVIDFLLIGETRHIRCSMCVYRGAAHTSWIMYVLQSAVAFVKSLYYLLHLPLAALAFVGGAMLENSK